MVNVLIDFFDRPMAAGIFYPRAFRQLGHEVMTIGPGENEVYGHRNWQDYTPHDIELPDKTAPVDVNELIRLATERGFQPDLVLACDQYDHHCVTGRVNGDTKFAYLAVENWNQFQYERTLSRQTDAEFFQISHDDNGRTIPPPFAIDKQGRPAEWVVFGADKDIHPLLNLRRDHWVCQIGSPYEPRPSIWNALRERFDNAGWMSDYSRDLHETEHTIFGKVFSYAGMAEAYNKSLTAISSSNCDFCPMRLAEAFAMGCVLLTDDVPSIRHFFGAPYPEDSSGIWVAHERTAESIGDMVEYVRDMPRDERDRLIARAYATVTEKYMYTNIAQRILERVGLA